MNDKPIRDCHGWIRRIDVSLRTRYPNLVTRIFETAPSQYVIVFDKAVRDAASIKKEFHDEIRFITANADISNEIPASYLREIPPLRDDELSHGFAGLPFPLPALFNLISARFPDLPVVSVRDGGTPMKVTVELAEEIDEASKRTLLEFCNGLEAPVPWNLVVSGRAVDAPTLPIPGAKAPPTDALQIRATRLRPQIPKFARQDEVFWFENIDKIYAGTLPVEKFPGIVQEQSQCFLDVTVGDHINLRQALMLYDTVYCSLPLAENHDAFLQKQAITEDDLLFLIEKGRLKIVSTQAEERLKIPFLEAASERHPKAIIGRRTAAALLVADIVQTADEYRLARPDLYPAIGELAKVLSVACKVPADELLRLTGC
jgi:sulfur relay (sulfurtransferase) DsrF/TusC family protein